MINIPFCLGKSRRFTMILLMLPLLCFTSLCGFAQNWDWQNPLPQGINLFSVNFPSADIGYSVGMDGKILKTTNGGQEWLEQESGVNTTFSSVYFTSVDTGYVVGYATSILKTTNGGEDWTQLSGPSPALTDVFFVNSNIGYAVGSNGSAASIYKTIDGGATWVNQNTGGVTFYNSVFFINETTGYVVGYGGKILKTTDGGANWVNQTSGTTLALTSVYFTDEQNGYAVAYGKILKTINGGTTWTTANIFQAFELYAVKFTDANTGYAVGRSGIVLKTTNAGASWSFLTTNTTITLRATYFTDALHGVAVGESGIMIQTADGGLTWEPFSTSPYYEDLNDAHFVSDCHGAAVGDNGTILKTINGGATWTLQSSGVSNHLLGVHFTSEEVGYVVGTAGFISKTTDGGATWTAQSSGLTVDLRDVFFTADDIGYVVGAGGAILKTIDGGANWLPQTSNVTNNLTCIHFVDINLGFIVGASGRLLKTTDGGAVWTALYSGTSLDLNAIYFPTASIGYLAGVSGHIRKTTNGGNNWTQQTNNINIALKSMAFTDVNNGYAVGYDYNDYGKIYQTTDGGTNWSVETISWDHNFNAVKFVEGNVMYIVGNNGAILRTQMEATTAENSGPVCAGAPIALQVATVAGASYAWSGPDGFSSSEQNPTIASASVAMSGEYTVLVSLNNCTSTTATTTIMVHEAPAAPVITNVDPICEGASLLLSSNEISGASYSWIGPNGFESTEQSPVISNAAELNMAGVYTLSVTVNNCTSAAAETMVEINATPAAPVITNVDPICEGASLSLSSNEIAGASYSWTGPNGFESTEQSPTISSVDENMAGVYTLSVTVNNCTSAEAEAEVVINPTPAAPVITNVDPICEGTSLALFSNEIAGASYSWTGPNGFESTEQSPVISNAAELNMAGVYTLSVTVNNCTSAAAEAVVEVNPIPAAPEASSNGPVDEGSLLTLAASFISGASYVWTGPNGFSSTDQNPTVSEAATLSMSGLYEVSVIVNGCQSPVSVVPVVVNEVNGVGEVSRNGDVRIYPNPTTEYIWIETTGTLYNQLHIVNALGAVEAEEKVYSSKQLVDVSTLAPGVYTIVLIGEGRSVLEKVMKN